MALHFPEKYNFSNAIQDSFRTLAFSEESLHSIQSNSIQSNSIQFNSMNNSNFKWNCSPSSSCKSRPMNQKQIKMWSLVKRKKQSTKKGGKQKKKDIINAKFFQRSFTTFESLIKALKSNRTWMMRFWQKSKCTWSAGPNFEVINNSFLGIWDSLRICPISSSFL